jgi:predicted RNA-binding protein with RPS1 domain
MRLPVGLRVNGTVEKVTDAGIFVQLDSHHYGLVPPSDFAGSWAMMRHRYRQDEQVRVVIYHHRGRCIVLSLTHVADPDLPDPTNEFSKVPDGKLAAELTKLSQEATQKIKAYQMQL